MEKIILLVDNHHGIYSYFFAYQFLNDSIKEQINLQLSDEKIKFISQDVNEIYGTDFDVEELVECFDKLCSIPLQIENDTYYIIENECDIWLVEENSLSEFSND